MSIKTQLQDKATSMIESMSERATSPQQIAELRQRLVSQIQSGEVQPYVGIPLVQQLTQRLSQQQQRQAQMVAGMGIPQAPAGQPIAEQIMSEAGGVDQLRSNLPARGYAPGGIVSFEEGGSIPRFQVGGVPLETAASLEEAAGKSILSRTLGAITSPFKALGRGVVGAGNAVLSPYGAVGAVGSDLSYLAADYLSKLSPEQREQLTGDVGSDTGLAAAIMNAAATPVTRGRPTAADPRVLGETSPWETAGFEAERARNMALANASSAPPATQPSGPKGAGGAGIPALLSYDQIMGQTPGATGTGTVDSVPLLDYKKIIGDVAENAKKASDTATNEGEKKLNEFYGTTFDTREARINKREAEQKQASSRDVGLAALLGGFEMMGSGSPYFGTAVGKGGKAMTEQLIRGEAASRAAKEKLEDARDSLDMQRAETKKGNFVAARALGDRAGANIFQAAQLDLHGADAQNKDSLKRFEINSHEKLSDRHDRLQYALKTAELRQHAADAAARLQLGREQLGVMKEHYGSQAGRLGIMFTQEQRKAAEAFSKTPLGMQLIPKLKNDYGDNWITNPKAMAVYNNALRTYIANTTPALLGKDGLGGIPDWGDAMKLNPANYEE